MLSDPFKNVMVPYISDQAIGICIDQVVVALKVVYNLVVELHHMQFTQIHYAGPNKTWFIIHHLLFEHLDEVEAVYASAAFEV